MPNRQEKPPAYARWLSKAGADAVPRRKSALFLMALQKDKNAKLNAIMSFYHLQFEESCNSGEIIV